MIPTAASPATPAMPAMPALPTLLVFTRGAGREGAHRRLLPRTAAGLERELHDRCLEAALEAGRQTGCRLLVSSPTPVPGRAEVHHFPQQGTSFGDRLRRAFRHSFATATGPVLLVGTDVPGLTARRLEESLRALRRDPEAVVLGPSPDGGFYLLASQQPLDRELRETRWCRADTLRTLVDALERRGRRVVFLRPLCDLDRPRDLDRWLRRGAWERGLHSSWRHLIGRLQATLAVQRRPDSPPAITTRTVHHSAPAQGRAPPIAA